jgi:protein arginine kinase
MKPRSELYAQLKKRHPFMPASGSIWVASTLKLNRNLHKYLFPTKLEKHTQAQILSTLFNALKSLPSPKFNLTLTSQELDPNEKQLLFEQFLSAESFQSLHGQEGFACDESGHYFALLNVHDHLQLQCNDTSGEIENAWNQLSKIDTHLGKALNFAFSARFGFLTARPWCCGTGLKAHLYLHLPALIHTGELQDILEHHHDERVIASDLMGTAQEYVGDLIMLSNHYCLGISEEEIISSLRSLATKLVVGEKSLRAKLKTEEPHHIKNIVSRAFGLLLHSYELEAQEAINAISLCKLGLDLGWLKGISVQELNSLHFLCQRGHLLSYLDQEISPQEIPIKRAAFLHESLKRAELSI